MHHHKVSVHAADVHARPFGPAHNRLTCSVAEAYHLINVMLGKASTDGLQWAGNKATHIHHDAARCTRLLVPNQLTCHQVADLVCIGCSSDKPTALGAISRLAIDQAETYLPHAYAGRGAAVLLHWRDPPWQRTWRPVASQRFCDASDQCFLRLVGLVW